VFAAVAAPHGTGFDRLPAHRAGDQRYVDRPLHRLIGTVARQAELVVFGGLLGHPAVGDGNDASTVRTFGLLASRGIGPFEALATSGTFTRDGHCGFSSGAEVNRSGDFSHGPAGQTRAHCPAGCPQRRRLIPPIVAAPFVPGLSVCHTDGALSTGS